MTVHRRPLSALAATVALFLPACLHIGSQPVPITPPEMAAQSARAAEKTAESARRVQFAETPSRPGAVVHAKAPDGTAPRPDHTVARTPGSSGEPVAPTPPGGLATIAAEPRHLLLGPTTASPIPSTESPLLAAVRAYAENRPAQAIEILKTLDQPNQEFVLAVLPALAAGATADLSGNPVAAAVVTDQLRTAAAQVEPRAALRIENATFCRKVSGFGRYDPWPAGQPYRPTDQAQFYLEVRNLVGQPTTGPQGETHLTHAKAAVEIRDAHGRVVEQPDPEDWRRRVPVVRFEKKLYTRGPVHDFHVLYAFPVPSTPGVYTVTVEIRDPAGRRSVKTAPAEFRVAGP